MGNSHAVKGHCCRHQPKPIVNKQSPSHFVDYPPVRRYACAVSDLIAHDSQNLLLRKGDLLMLSSDESPGLVHARNIITHEAGLIPTSAITEVPGISFIFDMWRDVDRDEALSLLTKNGVLPGTFLLRPTSDGLTVSLTLTNNSPPYIFNYRINASSRMYYMEEALFFPNLIELIEYYIAHPAKLHCTQLIPIAPLPVTVEPGVPPGYVHVSGAAYGIGSSRPLPQKRDAENEVNDVLLGRGSLAEVRVSTWKGRRVALKRLTSLVANDMLVQSLTSLMSLDGQHCVQILDVCQPTQSESAVRVVMEMMDGGSLKNYLASPGARTCPFQNLMKIGLEITRGMIYLESRDIVHTNLKDTNVLLDSAGRAKLTDIGMRNISSKAVNFIPEWFPFDCWSAPELEGAPTNCTFKSDVWALGVLLNVIFTRGSTPPAGVPHNQLYRGLTNNKPPDLGQEVYDAILRCFQYNPNFRPSFGTISSFFDGFHESRVYNNAPF